MSIEIKADNYRIVKSNKIVNSRQSFSALQQRIITVLASKINPEDTELREHLIHCSEFYSNQTRGGQQYQDIKNALNGLLDGKIEIESPSEEKWRRHNLFSKAEYDGKKQSVKISFAPDMKVFFLHLKGNYTSYLLRDVNSFNRAYTIRIYELCKQYYPQIKDRVMLIDHLKFLLSISTKYPRWGDFKDKVLTPSIAEINKHSDIFVSFDPIKSGRKVTSVQFKISKNPYNKIDGMELAEFEVVASKVGEKENEAETTFRLPPWLDNKNYQKLLKKYEASIIHFGIQKIEGKGKDVESPKAYLMKGLREGWFCDEAKKEQKQQDKRREVREEKDHLRQIKSRQEAIIVEFDRKRNDRIKDWLENVSEETIEDFIFDFEDSEDPFLQKVSNRLSKGVRETMDMKKVALWQVGEGDELSEEDRLFVQSDVRRYAQVAHGHEWLD